MRVDVVALPLRAIAKISTNVDSTMCRVNKVWIQQRVSDSVQCLSREMRKCTELRCLDRPQFRIYGNRGVVIERITECVRGAQIRHGVRNYKEL